MEEVFRSYVGFDGDGARRLRSNDNHAPQLHLRRWGKSQPYHSDAGGRWQHLRDHVHRRFKNHWLLLRNSLQITPQGTLTSFSFDGTDGAIPDAGFLLGRNGLLYGTTSSGGASGNGEVFHVTSQTGALTVLHSFAGSDGASPEAPLTLGPGGKYYGTTTFGGANNFGTVFSITASGTFKSLHSFGGAGLGQNPSAGLTLGSDGVLYGMTYGGGHQRFRNDLQDHRL